MAVGPTLRSPCQPLRSTGITLLHHYYELVRLPRALLEFLASSARYSIPPCGGILALPSSSQIIEYMSPSQTPVGIHSLTPITAASLLPSIRIKMSASHFVDNFEPQSVQPFGLQPISSLSTLRLTVTRFTARLSSILPVRL